MSRPPYRSQAGFSLVELMVALTIALLLLAGILQILLSNQESFRSQQTMAGVQENARLADFVIENAVAHAGFRVDLSSPNSILFPTKTDSTYNLAYPTGAFVAGSYGGTGASDSIRLRFQGAGGVHDCLGNAVGGPASTKVVTADYALLVSGNSLECVVYNSDGSAQTPQPLVDNVDRFKVTYGLDTNGDLSADTYVTNLTSTTALQIVSIRTQLLLESDANVLPGNQAQSYSFADGSTFSATDRHARQMLDQTTALRNALVVRSGT